MAIQDWLLSVWTQIFAPFVVLVQKFSTLQGMALALFSLAMVPRIIVFLIGRFAKFFKRPRLLVRAFNGGMRPTSNELIVLVSGIRSPKTLLRKTEKVLMGSFENSDVLKLRIDNAIFSNANPYEISAQIADLINAQYERKEKIHSPYDKVKIVSHSFGALFVRHAILSASAGFGLGRPNMTNRVASKDAIWRTKLDRIVMLAGINGGFDRNHSLWISFATNLLEFMGIGKLLLACERGKPFVETLRTEWIKLLRTPFMSPAPISVQINGDDDWAIPLENDLDLEAQINCQINPNHFTMEIGGSSHLSILDMAITDDNDLSLLMRRANILCDALQDTPEVLLEKSIAAPEVNLIEEMEKRAKIGRMIYVYDDGRHKDSWIETINQAAARMFGNVENVAVSREMPPHVSKFSFILNLFGRRERALRWFNAKCTRILAQYPNANLSIIALNNGTWISAYSLKENPALQIQTLFLSGSILPSEFPWDRIVKEGRLGLLCNALSHEDLFCSVIGGFYGWLSRNVPIIGRLRCFTLGDSGFAGFNWVGHNMGEIAYLEGTADAFLESKSTIRFATAFAAFGGPLQQANILATEGYNAINHETDPEIIDPNAIVTSDYVGKAAKAVKFLNRFSWAIGLAIICAIIGTIIGLGLMIYTSSTFYSSIAFAIPLILIILILDSL